MEGLDISNLKRLILIFSIVSGVNCANILGIFGAASHSTFVWANVLFKNLASRGHNITIISGDVSDKPMKNIYYIHLEKLYGADFVDENNDPEEMNSFLSAFIGVGALQAVKDDFAWSDVVCQGIADSEGLKVLLNYPDDFKFDLVLYDFTDGPCMLGFLHKFKYPPMVAISTFSRPTYARDLIGGNIHPSYIPHYHNFYDIDMTLWEKIFNHIIYYADYYYRDLVHVPIVDKMMRKFFSDDLPYLGDLEKHALLMLTNSHPAINYPEPLPPNWIEIGGLQIAKPKPLRSELEAFINASSKGTVLFSLGSNVQSVYLGRRICSIFLKALEGLPEYNFLWKLESDKLFKELPKNVMIGPWMPQTDILAHPKIKAFITHNGGLSTQEAIWFGVPMIGIPFFGDQYSNLNRMRLLGVAESVDIQTVTVDSFRETVRKVLETPSYTENVKSKSEVFRDRPMKPLETAVWWVEYAIRHPNTTHMRSHQLDSFTWKGHYVDITIFTLLFICSTSILSYIIITKICCGGRNRDEIENASKPKRKKAE